MQMLELSLIFCAWATHGQVADVQKSVACSCFGKKTMLGPLHVDGLLATLRETRQCISLEKIQF